MDSPHLFEMAKQRLFCSGRKHGGPILLSFAVADRDVVPDILPKSARTSSRVSTTGSRFGFLARTIPSIRSRSFSSTAW